MLRVLRKTSTIYEPIYLGLLFQFNIKHKIRGTREESNDEMSIRHCINVNRNLLSHFLAKKNSFAKKLSAIAFWRKYFLRGGLAVWENHGNSRRWGYDKHPLEWKFQEGEGSKTEVPSVGGRGGGGDSIFSGITQLTERWLQNGAFVCEWG